MATSDPSLYTLRYNLSSQQLEGAGGTPQWNALSLSNSEALASGKMLVGNTSNVATAVTLTGAITITTAGVTSLASGAVTPASISTSVSDNFTFPHNLVVNNTMTVAGSITSTLGDVSGANLVATSKVACTTVKSDQVGNISNFGAGDAGFYFKSGSNIQFVNNAADTVVFSGEGAIIPTKFTTGQRDAIAMPVEGMTIYNTTTHALNYYNGTAWKEVTAS